MKINYKDLIEQTFDFPQEEFSISNGNLIFNGIDLTSLIEQYGTPLKFTYLPKISKNINTAMRINESSLLVRPNKKADRR